MGTPLEPFQGSDKPLKGLEQVLCCTSGFGSALERGAFAPGGGEAFPGLDQVRERHGQAERETGTLEARPHGRCGHRASETRVSTGESDGRGR